MPSPDSSSYASDVLHDVLDPPNTYFEAPAHMPLMPCMMSWTLLPVRQWISRGLFKLMIFSKTSAVSSAVYGPFLGTAICA